MSKPFANNNENINFSESVFTYATIGILLSDSLGKIAAANPFALQEFGYTEQELLGKHIEVLIPQRFHQKHSHYHDNFIIESRTRLMGSGLDLYALKKDGTEFQVEISLSNFIKNNEQYVLSFIIDITARRKAENAAEIFQNKLASTIEQRTKALKATMQQLELANNKLNSVIAFQKAVLDNAGAMIIATDERGIIKLFNPEAALKLGYSPEELIDKETPVLFHSKLEIDKKRNELKKQLGITIANDFNVIVEKARRNLHEEQQFTYIKKDSTTFPVSLTVTAIKNVNETVTGFLGIAIDISKREQVEEDLRKALEKEIELSELKSRFVSMASHEFRTPLSTLLSSAYLIEKYTTTEDQPKREKHLQRMVSSISMLTDTLNDFLSVDKIEEGKIQIRLTEFDIHELITTLIKEIKGGLKNQQKIWYIHEGESKIFLDLSLLKHIIINLISNASKFSPEGGAIEIKTVVKGNDFILTVKDKGIGISVEDQKHLMQRFFRGSNAANIQGTGLGLHIISKYTELMNGKVECKSELDKGTEFIITFNLKAN